MSNERLKAAKIAMQHSAVGTTAAIKGGRCYEEIILAAVQEIGASKLARIIEETREASWAYYALEYATNLGDHEVGLLANVILDANCPHWALAALHHVSLLTEEQRIALAAVVIHGKSIIEAEAMVSCPSCGKYLRPKRVECLSS